MLPIEGKSFVRGDQSSPIWEMTIPELFRRTIDGNRTREAVVFVSHGVRWTFGEFSKEVDRVAAGLRALGLKPGDRVGIWSPNSPEWLLVQFATARIGLILVTINPAYKSREAEYVLKQVGVRALVIAEQFKSSCYVRMLQEMAPELCTSPRHNLQLCKLPELRLCIQTGQSTVTGMYRFEEVIALGAKGQRHELDDVSQTLEPEDAINIQFTSGTTGAPKGATLTHRNIVNNARFVATTLHLGQEDKLCIPVPLYHCFGMVMGSLACLTSATCMVFPAEYFEAKATLDALESERCTALYAVPTMFVSMLDLLDEQRRDLTSLRTGIMAGAPCPMEIMRKVISLMNMHEITIAYGMTETSPVSFQSHVDDPLKRKVETVGRIHPQVEVKIIDGQCRTVPVGQQGELCTRGYSVMKGYWNDPQTTAASIDSEGWMHTGDLGVIDHLGYCRITGRITDMVIRGGENIYPREIEEYIYRHPQVQVAQVFGIPDEVMGEELCAWIIPASRNSVTAEEIQEFCRQGMAHFKVPNYVQVTVSMPMTVTGKPQKFKMRESMIQQLKAGILD